MTTTTSEKSPGTRRFRLVPLYGRINRRDATQMPPLATEVVDGVGSATVRAWIAGLPP